MRARLASFPLLGFIGRCSWKNLLDLRAEMRRMLAGRPNCIKPSPAPAGACPEPSDRRPNVSVLSTLACPELRPPSVDRELVLRWSEPHHPFPMRCIRAPSQAHSQDPKSANSRV